MCKLVTDSILQIISVSVILLWLVVASATLKNIIYGNLFSAPCLREMEKASNLAAEKERQDA